MHLDIFNDDAFSLTQLTTAINDLPHVPGRLGRLGLFSESGISTTTVSVEKVGLTLSLVPSAPRGSSGQVKGIDRRNLRNLSTVHLPQRDAINADALQNLRAFGTESEVTTVQTVVNQKLAKMKRDNDVTIEWQRMGAVKGQVLTLTARPFCWTCSPSSVSRSPLWTSFSTRTPRRSSRSVPTCNAWSKTSWAASSTPACM